MQARPMNLINFQINFEEESKYTINTKYIGMLIARMLRREYPMYQKKELNINSIDRIFNASNDMLVNLNQVTSLEELEKEVKESNVCKNIYSQLVIDLVDGGFLQSDPNERQVVPVKKMGLLAKLGVFLKKEGLNTENDKSLLEKKSKGFSLRDKE